jgi:iron-sulfur cluster assembly protein
MAITLTPSAGEHVRKMLGQHDRALGLRLGTKKSGCTGFAYVVDYADEIGPEDRVFESEGVRVVVDSASLPQLDGTQVDFLTNNVLNKGFEFRNPNVRDSCGCGESFSV